MTWRAQSRVQTTRPPRQTIAYGLREPLAELTASESDHPGSQAAAVSRPADNTVRLLRLCRECRQYVCKRWRFVVRAADVQTRSF